MSFNALLRYTLMDNSYTFKSSTKCNTLAKRFTISGYICWNNFFALTAFFS